MPPVSSSSSSNYINDKVKVEKNENNNEKGDLSVVRYNHNGTTSDELTLNKGEYLIVTNWDIGVDYAYGYKKMILNRKENFHLL